ncbi:MAG: ABC transporter substrate-binding protein, partial [Alphaproteobacteria bacterium]|nr:ABC transporter substrate-binding protein [Alphaproteobacteria bacterium]
MALMPAMNLSAENAPMDKQKAIKYVKNIVEKAQNIAKTQGKSHEARMAFSKIITDAIPMHYIAGFSLGAARKEFTDAEMEKFRALLHAHMLNVYASEERVNQFANSDINLKDITINNCTKECEVGLEVTLQNKQKINVVFMTAYHDNAFSIRDIMFDGISTRLGLRSEIMALKNNKTVAEFLKSFEAEVSKRSTVAG